MLSLTLALGCGGFVAAQEDADSKPADAESPSDSKAQAFFDKALAALSTRESIQATLLEQVSISEQPIRLTGLYLEQGKKTRLELQVKLSADSRGSLLEVNDGDILWNQTVIGETRQVTLRNLKQITAVIEEDSALLTNGRAELGLGGLSGLMSSLQRTMSFEQLREDRDRDQKLVVVQGKWKPEFAQQWRAKPEQELPVYVPDALRIYFDAETLFPKRFLYLKKQPEKTTYRPLVRLEFQDVKFDVAIDEAQFQFTPPDGAVPDDVTKQYIDQMKYRKDVASKKAAEPSKEGDKADGL